MSVKTFVMEQVGFEETNPFSCINESRSKLEPVGSEGETNPFSSPNESIADKTIFYQFLCAIVNKFLSFLPKYFMDVCQVFSNGASWSLGANQPIFKFKRALEQVKPNALSLRALEHGSLAI
ncbi:hypothetical protein H5410_026495 [Solanum commersonii]|uniref:Uncharacterized protein n=1 Tax=Solanum commersonii TaxID=4109 RepID=A0A9J5YWB2_SOLCO|nr:hypothetical protein H5410_026495 [Solanum commersonii]